MRYVGVWRKRRKWIGMVQDQGRYRPIGAYLLPYEREEMYRSHLSAKQVAILRDRVLTRHPHLTGRKNFDLPAEDYAAKLALVQAEAELQQQVKELDKAVGLLNPRKVFGMPWTQGPRRTLRQTGQYHGCQLRQAACNLYEDRQMSLTEQITGSNKLLQQRYNLIEQDDDAHVHEISIIRGQSNLVQMLRLQLQTRIQNGTLIHRTKLFPFVKSFVDLIKERFGDAQGWTEQANALANDIEGKIGTDYPDPETIDERISWCEKFIAPRWN